MSERGVGTAPYGFESKGNGPWVALFISIILIIILLFLFSFHIFDNFLQN